MRFTVTLALLCALAAPLAAQSPSSAADSLMSEFARSDAPGGVVTVVENGEVVFQKGYGMASLEQATAIQGETIFDIGSVAKQFTGMAIAMLEDQGALSLDDDIRTYLPEVPDFGHIITIRHILSHTSGLREIYDAKALSGWMGGEAIEQQEALRVVSHMTELNFVPGSEYMYCNTAFMLAADIVSRVTGVSFPDWVQQNVFAPLGMDRTQVMDSLGEVIVGAADSYAPLDSGGFRRQFDHSSAYGQGGIYSSGKDMARWMANMGTMQIGSASVFGRLTTRAVLTSGDTLSYAMGISVREHRGTTVWTHTGASAGFRSAMAWFPSLQAGVFVQGNRSDFSSSAFLWGVVDAFYGDHLDAATPPTPPTPRREEALADMTAPPFEYLGRYISAELEALYSVNLRDGELVLTHRRLGDSSLVWMGEDSFTASGRGRIQFERDEHQVVTGFRVSTGRIRGLLFERLH